MLILDMLGDDGVIDGQGLVWWNWFSSHSLNYSRPHLVEFEDSQYVVVSNLTFLNTPAYNIHPVYCRYATTTSDQFLLPLLIVFTLLICPFADCQRICIEYKFFMCSNVYVYNISVYAPSESPYTVGIVPGLLCFFNFQHPHCYFV